MSESLERSHDQVQMLWGVRIPLRDRVQLSATLYLPKGQTRPSPVVITLTPYIGQTYHEQGLYFATHGYPFLSVDVRGRGNSEGIFKPFINEAKDGHDVVEWVARQSYCDGRVTMWGGSYAGHVQWATAKEFPPHLATIVPAAAPCIGLDFPFRGNIWSPYLIQWLTLVSGRTSQDRMFWSNQGYWRARLRERFESGSPFNELDTFCGVAAPMLHEWLEHPEQDAYWDAHNPTAEQYARISVPVLTITGAFDGNQPGALEHYRRHTKHCSAEARGRHCLVIGPWDHAGTRDPKTEFLGLRVGDASLVDLGQLHRDWYAWAMQDGPRPAFLQKNVAYYVMGADTWRYADTLESITARYASFYLESTSNPTDVFKSGSLISEPPAGRGPDHYIYDPRDVSLAEREAAADPASRVDQRMVHASHGRHLIYHSDPYPGDAEISGFFKLSLWLSIDQLDTDFRVSVHEVLMDGSAIQLTFDWMRARYREDFRAQKLVRTQAPLRYDFERFMFVSRRISKGSRLRLVVGPVNSIYSQKNFNSGGAVREESMADARPVTVRLFHDESHPSVLHVPLAQADVGS